MKETEYYIKRPKTIHKTILSHAQLKPYIASSINKNKCILTNKDHFKYVNTGHLVTILDINLYLHISSFNSYNGRKRKDNPVSKHHPLSVQVSLV